MKTKHDSFLYAAFIHNMENKNNLDAVSNKDQGYKMAQSYANTGFDLLGDMMENKTEAVAELELIKD